MRDALEAAEAALAPIVDRLARQGPTSYVHDPASVALAKVRAELAKPVEREWVLGMKAPVCGGDGSWAPTEDEEYIRGEIARMEALGWTVKRFDKRAVGSWEPADG